MLFMDLKRKGDVTISTVILIVLGLAVLVMLIVGFTQGFDTLFGIFDRAPSELQTLASACEGYAKASLAIDYCSYRIVEVDGNDEIVNCDHPTIKDILKGKAIKLVTCSRSSDGNLQSICSQIPENDRKSVKVNNKNSSDTVDNSKGEYKCIIA